ncbi:MAG: RNA polymerase sigma-70 factor [Cyclobacteriaceae bacterium]
MGENSNFGSLSDQRRIAAFKELYISHFDNLFFFANRILQSEAATEDVLSELFFNLWKNTDIDQVEDIQSYLYVSTKNSCLRYLKKNRKLQILSIERNDEPELAEIPDMETPEKELLYKELKDDIDTVINLLPTQCRLVFKLVKEDGLKHDQVAKALDISSNTVKNHIVKALRKIREHLQKNAMMFLLCILSLLFYNFL